MFLNPFSFKGRITRTEIGLSYFFSFFIATFLVLFFWENLYNFPFLFFIPPFICLIWFLISQGVKRCHDTGNSGLFLLIPFFFIAIILIEGERETNQYGPNPKKGQPTKDDFFKKNFHFVKPDSKTWVRMIIELFGLLFFTLFFISLLIYFFEHSQSIIFYGSGLLVIGSYYLYLKLTKQKEQILESPSYFFYNRLVYAVLLIVLIHLYFYYFRDIVFEEFHFFSTLTLVFNILFLTYLSFLLFKKSKKFKARFQKFNQLVAYSALFFVLTFLVGFNTKGTYADVYIHWSEQKLEWKDFKTTFLFLGDFDASIYSSIQIPKNIKQDEFLVYAYMNPGKSYKLISAVDDDQLLIHEQYHFNITEYVSRKMRKELVSVGKENLTLNKLKKLKSKYIYKIDSLQSLYDYETKHNLNYEKQRYWELKIDDLLRQTAYYEEKDLMEYYAFNPKESSYFRNVIQNFEGEILVSYPVSESESIFGKVYEVVKNENMTTVTYFENGEKKHDGYFNNAITTLIKDKNSLIMNYLNDEVPMNDKLKHAVEKTYFEKNGNVIIHYLDDNGNRVSSNNIFEVRYNILSNNEYLSFYFNEDGERIQNSRNCFHEKRTIDNMGRLIKQESFDRNLQPILNDQFVSVYEYIYDENNYIIQQKRYDSKGDFSYGMDAFNVTFGIDERGNLSRIENRDEHGNLRNDNSGVSIVIYDHDRSDNLISSRRFSMEQLPAWGEEEYFQIVNDYDSQGRKIFSATYYPDFVLKFDKNMWGATRYEYLNDTTRYVANLNVYNVIIADTDSVSFIFETMNSKKQIIEKRFYNKKKQFSIKENIPVVYKYKYDERGNMIDYVSFDSLSHRVPFEEDVARVRWDYDQNNNKIKTSYFKINGDIADGNQNASFNFYVYDEKNNLVERRNYDKHMQPVEVNGIYKYEIIVNERGNDSIVKYYGVDNKLITGASIDNFFYDEYQNLILKTFFDQYENPISNDYEVHKIKNMYDKYSKYIGESYFDTKLQPVEDIYGIHSSRLVFDNRNYILSQSYFDAQNNKVNSIYGFHKIGFNVNEQGLKTRETYFDSHNNKVAIDDGIADYLYQRFSSGMVSSYSLYDEDGYLINDSDGVAEYFYKPSLNGLYYISKIVDSDGNILKNREEIESF